MIRVLAGRSRHWLERARAADFLAPLLLRLYLAPVFIEAGARKLELPSLLPNAGTVAWFEHSLGLPAPALMAALAGWAEFFGGILLLLGLAVRLASIPLLATMAVAAALVHWPNGWLAIAAGGGFFATERTAAAVERLQLARQILREEGDYAWLTEHGSFVVLNNGIEFAATYFLMLLVLFFHGGGRYLSLDYWIKRRLGDG